MTDLRSRTRFAHGAMHGHHDDFGGLHRDLRSTGVAIGPRRMPRVAAGFGVGLGAIPLLACDSGDGTGP